MVSSWWLFFLLLILFAAIITLYFFAMKGQSSSALWWGFAGLVVILLILGGVTIYMNRSYNVKQTNQSKALRLKTSLHEFQEANKQVSQECGSASSYANCVDYAVTLDSARKRMDVANACFRESQIPTECEKPALAACKEMLMADFNQAALHEFQRDDATVFTQLKVCEATAHRIAQEVS